MTGIGQRTSLTCVCPQTDEIGLPVQGDVIGPAQISALWADHDGLFTCCDIKGHHCCGIASARRCDQNGIVGPDLPQGIERIIQVHIKQCVPDVTVLAKYPLVGRVQTVDPQHGRVVFVKDPIDRFIGPLGDLFCLQPVLADQPHV